MSTQTKKIQVVAKPKASVAVDAFVTTEAQPVTKEVPVETQSVSVGLVAVEKSVEPKIETSKIVEKQHVDASVTKEAQPAPKEVPVETKSKTEVKLSLKTKSVSVGLVAVDKSVSASVVVKQAKIPLKTKTGK